MRQKSDSRKRKPVFWILFFSYTAALAAVCVCILIHVRESLVLYESSQPSVYMERVLAELSSGGEFAGKVEDRYISAISLSKFDYEDTCRLLFREKLQNLGLSFRASGQSYDTSMPVYNVFAGDEHILTVTLGSVNPRTRLGIMTVSDWEILRADIPDSVRGTQKRYRYEIKAPDSCAVYVNDIRLGQEELWGEPQPIDEFEYASEYVAMPQRVSYRVEGLLNEPSVVVRNAAGEKVEYREKAGVITVEGGGGVSVPAGDFESEVNALEIAKTWSMFMTRDLTGPKYGVDQVLPYFIKNSYLYKMASRYASGIDITFVSGHVIDSFSGERVSNYLQYNERCFSCDVYFEKNMTLTKTGEKRSDIFNSRLYFVYIDDNATAKTGWYLVDMQAIIG